MPVRVLCSSCHRGLPIPRSIADEISEAETNGGGAAGLAKFKELRAKYYGGQQYDLRENALVGIANRATNAKRPDDALAYLQQNLEYFPKSSVTFQAMAQAKTAKGDRQGATKDLEKAVELDPQNAQAKTLPPRRSKPSRAARHEIESTSGRCGRTRARARDRLVATGSRRKR